MLLEVLEMFLKNKRILAKSCFGTNENTLNHVPPHQLQNDNGFDGNSEKKFLFQITFKEGQLCCSKEQDIKKD